METLETLGNMEGNTKIPRVVPAKYWCFTLNNYSDLEMETLETDFVKAGVKYCFEKEIGESGTPHLQGFIQSNTKIRPTEKFKNKRIHWEKAKGSEEQNKKYTTKDGKEVHTNLRIVKDKLKTVEMYDWQSEVIKIIKKEPDDRTIHWIWDKKGNKGKTELAKHICLNYNAIYVNGKASDVKHAIVECKNKPEIIIFGIPRSNEEYVSYAALEEIKDGIFFSGKYESGMVIYPIPHVIVLCNFAPDIKKLSEDRWNIINIGSNDDESTDEETDNFGLD